MRSMSSIGGHRRLLNLGINMVGLIKMDFFNFLWADNDCKCHSRKDITGKLIITSSLKLNCTRGNGLPGTCNSMAGIVLK